ncbi:MAG: deoxyguanosinetriphosphate triphosphohydrolase [Bacteroidota bacterium]|nr:deoxyguanosinetriphosphate triphosphohydrolase [Odoribacter sp.]MDP3643278.1 deoxyguanosinetriphosphate triphosphohydrolase [Bacteroidota bacterium]
MNWNQIISTTRLGQEELSYNDIKHSRTQFQRDYDRIIFSSPFRRMQNKTQVFPLPGSVFVHNRLTHSLEVASVGRSLGSMFVEKAESEKMEIENPLFQEIGSVVSAACLAHDMGNPPFGHSGEDAIAQFFKKNTDLRFRNELSEAEWKDFAQFDGNANAFRLLSHQFNGRRAGGFALTYTTLASIVKYPYESMLTEKPKFGFFQSEKTIFATIANELGLLQTNENTVKYIRHPLVFLVEAADDICYQLMDLEDAHKLKIHSYEQTRSLFMRFFDPQTEQKQIGRMNETLNLVADPNEQIAYLRASVIGKLVKQCVNVFWEKQDDILSGRFQKALINHVPPGSLAAIKEIKEVSIRNIYNDRSVIEIEISGYQIIGTLLEVFIEAFLSPKEGFSKKLLQLIPDQYGGNHESTYEKVQAVVDFVSGMTDLYALDLYRKIKGINIPGV